MSRHHKLADHFDLLPFISILMCTLGALLLITFSVGAINLLNPRIGIVPIISTNTNARVPVAIEWDGAVALLHRGQERDPIRIGVSYEDGEVKVEENDTDGPAFKTLVDDLVTRSNTTYALFIVRPSGFESFPLVNLLFSSRGIQTGYEPFEEDQTVEILTNKLAIEDGEDPGP